MDKLCSQGHVIDAGRDDCSRCGGKAVDTENSTVSEKVEETNTTTMENDENKVEETGTETTGEATSTLADQSDVAEEKTEETTGEQSQESTEEKTEGGTASE